MRLTWGIGESGSSCCPVAGNHTAAAMTETITKGNSSMTHDLYCKMKPQYGEAKKTPLKHMTGHLTVVYQSRNEGHGTIWFDFDAEFLG